MLAAEFIGSGIEEMPIVPDEQQEFLAFIAEMDVASEMAETDGATIDEVSAIYEAYGDRLHAFVDEDYGKGRELLRATFAYLQQHDCSTEAVHNLENAYTHKYGSDDEHTSERADLHNKFEGMAGRDKKQHERRKINKKKLGWWALRASSILRFFTRSSTT